MEQWTLVKCELITLFNKPHSGCPKQWQIMEVEQIDEKIHQNWAIPQWQLTKETGVALRTIKKMIKKLNYRKICAKWVPKLLTDEMKAARKEEGQQFLPHYYREDEQFLRNIATRDEPWISHYDPQLKQQSTEYYRPFSPHHKKILTDRATRKVMLTVFWNLEVVMEKV